MSGKACASKAGIELIRSAMKSNGWTQTETAKEAGFARSTLNQILSGQSVKRENLEELCHLFDLEVGQVLVLDSNPDIDNLVKQLRDRSREDIKKRCGTMRVLDMTQPVDTDSIYTDVNILEKVSGKTRSEISQLIQECGVKEFDRFFLGNVRQERVDGLEAIDRYNLLMILGQPGAGKTTFLKRLAMLCSSGKRWSDRVPMFVSLKEFADAENRPTLMETIGPSFTPVLVQGRGLVLLDGLDEVQETEHDRILAEIRDFSRRYGQNQVIITCRIAAREYIFEQFTEVEMADFNDEQIGDFVRKWFKPTDPAKAELFIESVDENGPVKELATNPLLLTLLCLEFAESSQFPASRSELYERGLNVLLTKWDGQRRIHREEVYKKLSIKRKVSLLGQLAMHTFERGDYFFKQSVAERKIGQYIENLPDANTDPDALMVDSSAVLKSIESHHGLLTERATGIYSFSHLTFHEYFTAKHILETSNPAAQEELLNQLVKHITDKPWREVFLLVVEQLEPADYLLQLMQRQIDKILADDPRLQEYLVWLEAKSESIQSENPNKIRLFYLDRDRDIHSAVALVLESAIGLALNSDLDSDLDSDLALALNLGPEFKLQLQEIRDRLPDKNNTELYEQQGKQWTEDLRQIMIKYRNIGHDWQFTDEQTHKLKKYYDANKLLIDCLECECCINRPVREEIEATMMLPVPFLPCSSSAITD